MGGGIAVNINEAEIMTGLTRANIRFYEKEGLIEVERLANGYRDYSQENIDDLKKIMLLRRLQFTIEEIRQARNGERGLDELLIIKETEIAGQIGELEAARAVCSEMLADGVSFVSMDAGKYLLHMEDKKKSVDDDVAKGNGHSGRRFLALLADYFIYNFVLSNGLIIFTGHMYVMSSRGGTFIKWACCILLTVILEPLFLSLFAATPGKLIFGLRVYEASGRRLSYKEAFERVINRFIYGEGFRIPIYRIYKLYESYKSCDKLEVLEWDWNTKYEIREMSWKNFIGGAAYSAGVIALGIAMIFSGNIPKNKGDITPEQFVENFNQASKNNNYGMRIRDGGDGTFEWEEDESEGLISFDFGRPEDLYYITTNGFVTEIGYVYEDNDDIMPLARERVEYLSMLSLLAARENIFTLGDMENFILEVANDDLVDKTYTFENVKAERTIEEDGYENYGGMLIKDDDNYGSARIKWYVRLE